MDIARYNSIKASAEAYVRERNFSNLKIDPNDPQNHRVKAKKTSPEEAAANEKMFAENDKRLAEVRAQLPQRAGAAPQTEPFKYERKPPMTKEEGEAYVQGVLDRMVEGDAKFQQLLQFTRQWESGSLPQTTQGSQVNTSA